MINAKALLADLQKLLVTLESDLRQRCTSHADVDQPLRDQYAAAKAANRTAQAYEVWRDEQITQAAVAWILGCVFVRFCEDNHLIDPPRLSGPAEGRRRQRAEDEHTLYFQKHPTHSDREYLQWVFEQVAQLPAMKELFDKHHNPLWSLGVSGDGAMALREFFLKRDAATGLLVHDFTDPAFVTPSPPHPVTPASSDPTRFLGDLYQDLSESARKKFALLQTPVFVEEFILDRTLTPALREFSLAPSSTTDNGQRTTDTFRMIDPTCGSGHFLLGGFHRLFDLWVKQEPATNVRVLAQRTLDGVYGVDLNPFAVAIAGFRLLVAALRVCDIRRLIDAPGFSIHLATGDSLLHGPRPGRDVERVTGHLWDDDELKHHYEAEDSTVLRSILGRQYHAVVGNPPYIVMRDKALSDAYRDRFGSCHRQYSLAVPFFERFVDLTLRSTNPESKGEASGFFGMITANSFMKREFGKKLIEQLIPKWDLTHVIDTSGAYIPGHGTPTVILFGRHRRPATATIRTAMGIAGEPSTPGDPVHGQVWTAILAQLDQPGSQGRFISVADSGRAAFHVHPWSIGGGGASELKESLDEVGAITIGQTVDAIGFYQDTHADEVFVQDIGFVRRRNLSSGFRNQVRGDEVRDWNIRPTQQILFPYDKRLEQWDAIPLEPRWAWLYALKIELESRSTFGGRTYKDEGRYWFDYHQFPKDRARARMLIAFGEVATHNHFVLDRSGNIFNRTAPVMKLPAEATEDDHLVLLGLLNSSTACFWLKQVCHNKGSTVDQHGARQRTAPFEDFFAFNATKLEQFPLPEERPLSLAKLVDQYAVAYAANLPDNVCRVSIPDQGTLAEALQFAERFLGQMIAMQEEIDWECYRLYGLIPEQRHTDFQSIAHRSSNESPAPRDYVSYGPPSSSPSDLQSDPSMEGKVRVLAQEFVGAGETATTIDQRISNPPVLELGQRAFEIVLARQMAAGEVETTWFERHGSTPITKIPDHWPEDYKQVVRRRIEIIETDKNIALIEKPEYKRRWNTEPWEEMQERALRSWLLDRLEGWPFEDDKGTRGQVDKVTKDGNDASSLSVSPPHPVTPSAPAPRSLIWNEKEPRLMSVAQLADRVRQDKDFVQVAALYRGREDFDLTKLVAELVEDEAVPALAVLRYKESGLRNRRVWEQVWDLQRLEDAIDARTKLPPTDPQYLTEHQAKVEKKTKVGDIPVPPKYKSADMLRGPIWRLRGKLDVPKERFVSFPHCQRDADQTLVITWAGFDHLQQLQAVAAYYMEMKEREGWPPERRIPLLAAMMELLPWVLQWHNAVNPDFGIGLGDYYRDFINEEAKEMGKTVDEVKAWVPPTKSSKRAKTAASEPVD